MKAFSLLPFLLLPFFAPLCAKAATLENQDFKNYDYEIIADGKTLSFGTIYEKSSLYGICEYGCRLKLIGTGQIITVEPGDHILIEDGVLTVKEELRPIMIRPGGSSEGTQETQLRASPTRSRLSPCAGAPAP